MAKWQTNTNVKYPLKMKIILLVLVAIIPLLGIALYLITALENYRSAYDTIVSNMTVANNYNLDFKEELDAKTAYIEEMIRTYLPEEKGYQKTVIEAMNYSVLAGGKGCGPC